MTSSAVLVFVLMGSMVAHVLAFPSEDPWSEPSEAEATTTTTAAATTTTTTITTTETSSNASAYQPWVVPQDIASQTSPLSHCSIERFGHLTLFNGETASVEMPCKFRLADFRCAGFRVQVTSGQIVDGYHNNRFSVDTVRVKVKSLTSGQVSLFRSQTSILRKAQIENADPWQTPDNQIPMEELDVVGYDPAHLAAKISKTGVFEVLFSSPRLLARRGEGDSFGAGIDVRCFSADFSSTGLDKSLCGDGTSLALRNRKVALSGCGQEVTHAQFYHQFVLGNKAIMQRCLALSKQFQNCPLKENAARSCEAIMGKVSLARCLAPDLSSTFQDLYSDCLKYACDGDLSAITRLRQYVRKHCPDLMTSVPQSIC